MAAATVVRENFENGLELNIADIPSILSVPRAPDHINGIDTSGGHADGPKCSTCRMPRMEIQ
jgi:hypothetical protein